MPDRLFALDASFLYVDDPATRPVWVDDVASTSTTMYAGRRCPVLARMVKMFPVVPLVRNQAPAIDVTSYRDRVYFGQNGDQNAVSDVAVLVGMIEESLEESQGAQNW